MRAALRALRRAGLSTVMAVAAALAALLPAGLAAQEQRPPLNAGRVAAEVVVGAYAGIGGFVIGRFVGEGLSDAIGVGAEDTRRNVGRATGFVVAGLATAGTVYGIGNIGDETGDFDVTALGTGVGFIAALAIARVALGPNVGTDRKMGAKGRWLTINALALLPAVGATVGFNSSRRIR
ncbi:MAG: hypothetical protein WD771_12195 [Gemmatimonadaceae bacterium]